MALTVSTITIASIAVSLAGIVLAGYLTAKTWQRFHRHPSNLGSWRFIAAMALLTAYLALLTTASGSALVQLGGQPAEDFTNFFNHLAFLLRGGFFALSIALVYGWTHIERNGGHS